jgi:hypothetical protein
LFFAPMREEAAGSPNWAPPGRSWSSMAPAAGALWPDLAYADPEPDTDQESYGYSGSLNTTTTD